MCKVSLKESHPRCRRCSLSFVLRVEELTTQGMYLLEFDIAPNDLICQGTSRTNPPILNISSVLPVEGQKPTSFWGFEPSSHTCRGLEPQCLTGTCLAASRCLRKKKNTRDDTSQAMVCHGCGSKRAFPSPFPCPYSVTGPYHIAAQCLLQRR